eukprot:CAMPEP_0183332850 /NCGR_PEP_ID=MMETSP0164_2-20130417/1911_1 /TAXON_ID=221442 /ORGANISM="Coccolithus pelagicus ssp braarudi, Strain PLY182g" /LENGTH=254 /DNA_ID=CAMNT_0025501655 /DNA_START=1 /DNA_END=762 /DNA_ORIENTATION=-
MHSTHEVHDVDPEGEEALAELEAQEAKDGLRELQRRGAPVISPSLMVQVSAPVSRGHSLSAQQIAVCIECRNAQGQAKLRTALGISVCYECSQGNRGPGGKYQMISKKRAKEEYLLTDRQLDAANGGLGCIKVPNPTDSRYGDMSLYLRSQVEGVALTTWKSDEGLFLEKERRREARLQRSETTRKVTKGTLEERMAARAQKESTVRGRKRGTSGAGGSSKARASSSLAGSGSTAPHKHIFLPNEVYDEARDIW